MKKISIFLAVLFVSCGGDPANSGKTENALDAGREFIGACLQGDFPKAAHLIVPNDKNREKLTMLESFYRQKDKEGRQQYRTASINIKEVKEMHSDTTVIYYSNSFDKTPETIRVVKNNDSWLVDL